MAKRYLFKPSPYISTKEVTRDALIFTLRLALQTEQTIYTTAETKTAFPPQELEDIHPHFFEKIKLMGVGQVNNAHIKFILAKHIYNHSPIGGVLFVPYTSIETLRRFDNKNQFKHIIYVARTKQDAEAWENTWPREINIITGQPCDHKDIDQTIATQLMIFTARTNLLTASRLNHKERTHIENAFQTLQAQGKSEDPKAIVQWAVRHGWSKGILSDLHALSEHYFGKKVQLSTHERLVRLLNN